MGCRSITVSRSYTHLVSLYPLDREPPASAGITGIRGITITNTGHPLRQRPASTASRQYSMRSCLPASSLRQARHHSTSTRHHGITASRSCCQHHSPDRGRRPRHHGITARSPTLPASSRTRAGIRGIHGITASRSTNAASILSRRGRHHGGITASRSPTLPASSQTRPACGILAA
jgi:hypothetical protein